MIEREPVKELVPICRWCYPQNPEGMVLKPDQDTTNKICPGHLNKMISGLKFRQQPS